LLNGTGIVFGGAWDPSTTFTTAYRKIQGYMYSVSYLYNFTASNYQLLAYVAIYNSTGIEMFDETFNEDCSQECSEMVGNF